MVIRGNEQNCRTEADQRKQAMYCAIFDELRKYVRAKTIRQISTVITGSTPAQWNLFCRLLEEGDTICSLIGLCYNVAYSGFDSRWFMGGLQGKVAQLLAARVMGTGEREHKIGSWARRRVVPYDAVFECAPAKTRAEIMSGSSSRPDNILPSNDANMAAASGNSSSAEESGMFFEPGSRASETVAMSHPEYELLQGAFDVAGFLASQNNV
ncbi:hypothetical protein Slin15195_G060590 [Septoria linicola]|uniref:Uncharacterized protein n=1 Tax=Septoria linicola TaxID=215465 RepID=A0A9Q9EJ80_9PEZI|nr:hypothetical protein Slin14017_G076430 [Septoria linicola]USW52740.1 hypothetical protein Slin15195_G060590 [Septoria linicola]